MSMVLTNIQIHGERTTAALLNHFLSAAVSCPWGCLSVLDSENRLDRVSYERGILAIRCVLTQGCGPGSPHFSLVVTDTRLMNEIQFHPGQTVKFTGWIRNGPSAVLKAGVIHFNGKKKGFGLCRTLGIFSSVPCSSEVKWFESN